MLFILFSRIPVVNMSMLSLYSVSGARLISYARICKHGEFEHVSFAAPQQHGVLIYFLNRGSEAPLNS